MVAAGTGRRTCIALRTPSLTPGGTIAAGNTSCTAPLVHGHASLHKGRGGGRQGTARASGSLQSTAGATQADLACGRMKGGGMAAFGARRSSCRPSCRPAARMRHAEAGQRRLLRPPPAAHGRVLHPRRQAVGALDRDPRRLGGSGALPRLRCGRTKLWNIRSPCGRAESIFSSPLAGLVRALIRPLNRSVRLLLLQSIPPLWMCCTWYVGACKSSCRGTARATRRGSWPPRQTRGLWGEDGERTRPGRQRS